MTPFFCTSRVVCIAAATSTLAAAPPLAAATLSYRPAMMNKTRHRTLLKDVCYLMHRHHSPVVEVRPSYLPNAGMGVFVKRPIEKGRIVCLYPGIYTRGLPKYAAESEETVLLADKVPPSGGDMESNAYILNLGIPGGYLDGAALVGLDGRLLDDNPSACGHLINHSSNKFNVEMVSFQWKDVINEIDYNEKHLMALPNDIRADGLPWYLDGFSGNTVSFPSSTHVDVDETYSMLSGAAFCSQQDLEAGTEILLNYKLKGPHFPEWAEDWYEQL